jgi:hypothetical protein
MDLNKLDKSEKREIIIIFVKVKTKEKLFLISSIHTENKQKTDGIKNGGGCESKSNGLRQRY